MSSRAELFRALGSLVERPDSEHAAIAAALELPGVPTREEHTHAFGLSLYPYASVYLGSQGMLGGEAGDRIAGFWNATGYGVPAEPDHLTALLGLYAAMVEAETAERDPARRLLRAEARRALLWEHLIPWLPVYLTKMRDISSGYAGWADMLLGALQAEAVLGSPPATTAAHLRAAPAFRWEDGDRDTPLKALLAPVVSGIILTRSDLVRCARELELGLRIGERLFMLRSLFEQAPDRVAEWLSDYAGACVSRYAPLRNHFNDGIDHWVKRAQITETILRDLGHTAREVVRSGAGS